MTSRTRASERTLPGDGDATARAPTVRLSDLIGRTVRDTRNRAVGKIEDFTAEIALSRDGNDYVVTRVAIGRYGVLDMIVSGAFVPDIVQRWLRLTKYERLDVAWDALDMSDPSAPRLLRRD